jgi:Leucine-rich repeat (LRR) protein
MTNLVRLNIEGNPLKRLVTKMKSANTEQIKSYLKSRITEQELQSTPLKHKDYYDITTNTNSSINDGVNIISCVMNANLNLSKQKLNDIPVDNIMNYIQKNTLDKIDLSDNAITNIYPIEHILPLIQSLKELNLSNNNINMFPICILSLPNLSVLNVSKNKLSSFPYEQFTSSNINMLNSNLSYIDLSFNVFKVIPDVIGLFSNLSSLILANNQLERIDNLQKMKLNKVDTINFANNKIEIIPHKLYRNIPNVKVFVMENNNLKDIPSDLCLMFGLNVVNFYGNAIKRIRSNLLANAQGLLSYLKRLHQYDNEDLAYEEARNFGMEGNVQVMQQQQQQQQLQQQMNQQQQQCDMQMMNQNTNEMSKDEQMKQINIQIEMIEQELQLPNLAMYKRTDLRKQLNGLIRQRARLLK